MMEDIMRRRDLFALTAAIAGGTITATAGCSPLTPTPSSSERVPVRFGETPVWPGNRARTEITAVRDRYLVAMAEVSEVGRLFHRGWVPVIVNVPDTTTRALLIDDDGTWATHKVKMKEKSGRSTDSGNAPTTLIPGPAAIDDTHAYIVVGVSFDKSPGAAGSAVPVVLLKVQLSDGSVVATTTISDGIRRHAIKWVALSLTEDGGSLLLASDDGGGTDWIGLRLSTADLSVEFDARTLVVGQQVHSVRHAVQGVLVGTQDPNNVDLIRLADGTRRSLIAPGLSAALILDEWTYRHDLQGQKVGFVAVHEGSGDRVEVSSSFPERLTGVRTTSSLGTGIFTGNRAIIDFTESSHLRVWQPGAPEPRFDFSRHEPQLPQGVAVFNDVLYTWRDDVAKTLLTLRHLDSGEVLAESSLPQGLLGPGVGAVTSWGVVSQPDPDPSSEFVRATEWLP